MICGIDASTSCTGLCIFDEDELVYYAKITPLSKHNNWEDNAIDIINQIVKILDKYSIDKIFMEDVPQYAKKGSRGGVMIKTPIILGGVHMLFYYKLYFEKGYNIVFLDVDEWRQSLGFLKGNQRDRESMKQKAVDFVNEKFNLNLYFVKGSKTKKNDDDIAESIAIVCSTRDKYRKPLAFGKRRG
jgi:hypothetical protein